MVREAGAGRHDGRGRALTAVEELGLAILIVGGLLVIDRDRLEWASAKVRDLIEWLTN